MSPFIFQCVACRTCSPAEDEYHWWLDDGQEIVWHLCPEHLLFAEEVVECIGELDNERERERWKL